MSVVAVRQIGEGQQGSQLESRRIFRVQVSSASDDEQTIRASGMVPIRGAGHPTRPDLFVLDVKCRRLPNSALYWIVEVEYGRITGSLPQLAKEFDANPLVRRVKVEGKSLVARRAIDKSRLIASKTIADWQAHLPNASIPQNESPVETSAFELYEGCERDESEFIWEIILNVEAIPFFYTTYQDHMNSDQVTIRGVTLPRWSLKFSGFSHSDLLEEEITETVSQFYYQVRFNLHYKRTLWITARPDRGFLKWTDANGQQEILIDGRRPAVPVLLDGFGQPLDNPSPDDTVYNWYADYPEKPFSPILDPLAII